MKTEIKLEDHVKYKYTGMKGVAMTKTEFINGCIQFGIGQKFDPKASLESAMAEFNIDSQSLVIIKKGPRHKKIIKEKPVKEKFTGGPSRILRRRM